MPQGYHTFLRTRSTPEEVIALALKVLGWVLLGLFCAAVLVIFNFVLARLVMSGVAMKLLRPILKIPVLWV